MSGDGDHGDDVERIVGALLYLLVRSNTKGACCRGVHAIQHHLTLLASHPDSGSRLREIAAALAGDWHAAMQEAERRAGADLPRRCH